MADKGRVTGIGGLFIKVDDLEATKAWYQKVLGLSDEQGFGMIFPYEGDKDGLKAYNLLSFFKSDTDYFKPATKSFMVNLRVDCLDSMLVRIKAAGVDYEGPVDEEGCGRFAWIVDPNGIKVELWQQ